MKESLFLKELEVHRDWFPLLTEENLNLIASIEAEVTASGFTPSAEKVLRFFTVPLISVKIIILGQDPYPQPGVATGRAFEVGNLQSWNQPFQNNSLKNILRAIYKAYTGEVILFNRLKKIIDTEFPVLSPAKLFEHWENQGVLLLNTSFTCVPGKPGSHQKLWNKFSDRLLQFISMKVPYATWFIWGNHAASAIENLQLQKCITSMHPMLPYNGPGRTNDFLYGEKNCFEPFIYEVDWTGYSFREGTIRQGNLF